MLVGGGHLLWRTARRHRPRTLPHLRNRALVQLIAADTPVAELRVPVAPDRIAQLTLEFLLAYVLLHIYLNL